MAKTKVDIPRSHAGLVSTAEALIHELDNADPAVRKIFDKVSTATSTTWRTPPEVIDLVRKFYGGKIDFDPCADDDSRNWFALTNIPKRIDDGIARKWSGNIFVNPPYGRAIAKWIEAGLRTRVEAPASQQIWLVPARLDTAWWRDLLIVGDVFAVFGRRLKFVGAEYPAPFPSALVYAGSAYNRFAVFAKERGLTAYVEVLDESRW